MTSKNLFTKKICVSFLLFLSSCVSEINVQDNGDRSSVASQLTIGQLGEIVVDFENTRPQDTSEVSVLVYNNLDLNITFLGLGSSNTKLSYPFTLLTDSSCTSLDFLAPRESCELLFTFSPTQVMTYSSTAFLKYKTSKDTYDLTIYLRGSSSSSLPEDILYSTPGSVMDTISPVDNGASLVFETSFDNSGDEIKLSWIPFSDNIAVTSYKIHTYTDADCTSVKMDMGYTASSTNYTWINDLVLENTYYATVTAYDAVGNSTTSDCSDNSITIDKTNPTDNDALVEFSESSDDDGDDIEITWTAFSDENGITDHRILLFSDASCSFDMQDMGLTGSDEASATVDNLHEGDFYVTVTAYDAAGNYTTSDCSASSINVSYSP